MDDRLKELGNFIKAQREALKISQSELAERSGLSKGFISQIERAKNPKTSKPINPRLDTLQSLAKGLGVPLAELERIALGHPIEPEEDIEKAMYGLFQAIDRLPIPDEEKKRLRQINEAFLKWR